MIRPEVGVVYADDRPCAGRFSTTALSDQPEGASPGDVKADAVHGSYDVSAASFYRKVFDEITNLEDRSFFIHFIHGYSLPSRRDCFLRARPAIGASRRCFEKELRAKEVEEETHRHSLHEDTARRTGSPWEDEAQKSAKAAT